MKIYMTMFAISFWSLKLFHVLLRYRSSSVEFISAILMYPVRTGSRVTTYALLPTTTPSGVAHHPPLHNCMRHTHIIKHRTLPQTHTIAGHKLLPAKHQQNSTIISVSALKRAYIFSGCRVVLLSTCGAPNNS